MIALAWTIPFVLLEAVALGHQQQGIDFLIPKESHDLVDFLPTINRGTLDGAIGNGRRLLSALVSMV